jgi:flagellar hook-length control protein FliK
VSETGVISVGANPPAVTDFKRHLDGITGTKSKGNCPEAGASQTKRSRSVKELKLTGSGASKGNPAAAGPPTEVAAPTPAVPSREASTQRGSAQSLSSDSTSIAATAAVDPASKGSNTAATAATASKGTEQQTSAVAEEPRVAVTSPQVISPSVASPRSASPSCTTSPQPLASARPSESPTIATGRGLMGPTSTRGEIQGGGAAKGDVGSGPHETATAVTLQTGRVASAQSPAHVQSSPGSASGGMGALPVTSLQAHPAPAAVTVPAEASPASTASTSQSQQMLLILSPVLNRPNGIHQVSIEMHPADLGTIQATVTVQSGHVTVELHADHPGARQALGTALPDLRQQLGSGGRHADVFLAGSPRSRISGSPSQLSFPAQPGATGSSLLVTSQGVNSRTSVDLRL